MAGKKGCLMGLVLGSLLKLVVSLGKAIVFVLSWTIVYLGLWVPILYAVLGLILYFAVGFNPFDWTVWGQLYFAGAIAAVVAALALTVRNLIVKPLRSVGDGYKNPVWKKKSEDVPAEKPMEKPRKSRREALPAPAAEAADYEPQPKNPDRSFRREAPIVYESELEHGSIVHEYSDRFEVFVVKNGRLVLDKVEMKNEDE